MSRPPCLVPGCILTGPHDRHLTAGGRTFTREVDRGVAVYTVTEPDQHARPERPCTYDPADEEPEGEPVIIPARHEYTPGPWVVAGFPAVAPQGGPDPMATMYPSDMFVDGTPHACPTVEPKPTINADCPCCHAKILRPGVYRLDVTGDEDRPYLVSVLSHRPEPDALLAWIPGGHHDHAAMLRSYLRTLTNPDATPQDVVDALAALTPEDRALVTALTARTP